MSEQLYRLGDPHPWYFDEDIDRMIDRGVLVPVTKEDIINSPELTELLWNAVYGEAVDE